MVVTDFAVRFRQRLGEKKLTQQKIADRLLVSRQTVARWLSSTIPIARHLGGLAQALDVSPQWLLTGSEEAHGIVHGRHLEALARRYAFERRLGQASAAIDPLVRAYEEILRESEERAAMAKDKLRELSTAWHKQVDKIQSEILAGPETIDLTTSASSSNELAVREIPSLDELLNEVRLLTKGPGAKKALADRLGFPQQAQLSRWLSVRGSSANYAPSAPYALKLLKWVVEQRRAHQKQSAEAVLAAAAPTTRKRSSNDANNDSGRKKVSPKAGRKAIAKPPRGSKTP
ncbi:MAG: helix-turn-helix domain-containing protein [Chthoniobacterales bacterium]